MRVYDTKPTAAQCCSTKPNRATNNKKKVTICKRSYEKKWQSQGSIYIQRTIQLILYSISFLYCFLYPPSLLQTVQFRFATEDRLLHVDSTDLCHFMYAPIVCSVYMHRNSFCGWKRIDREMVRKREERRIDPLDSLKATVPPSLRVWRQRWGV